MYFAFVSIFDSLELNLQRFRRILAFVYVGTSAPQNLVTEILYCLQIYSC